MTNKAKIYMTRIQAAANLYDLQSVEIAFKQDSTLSWEDIERLCRASDDKRYRLRNNEETKRLKEILFIRTQAEMDAYHDMSRKPESWTKEKIENQRSRFCSLWQVIEKAELADEYDAWKYAKSLKSEKPQREDTLELKGCFVRKPYTIDDLRTAHRKGKLKSIRVIATEWMEENEFRRFGENLLEEYPFIQRHKDEAGERGGVMYSILVRCKGHCEAIAVEPEGYDYARYAALVTVE